MGINIKDFKRLLFFLTLICLVIVFTIPVFAHSGRTDSNGGHYDTSTGEYHYHHGYSAHQHTNGVCPYEYDDKTSHNSNQDSGSKSSSQDSTSFFGYLVSFILWVLITGLLELCLFPLIDKIKDVDAQQFWHRASIAIWLAAALYLAITSPFF